jgi:uracil-DNA glycosylase
MIAEGGAAPPADCRLCPRLAEFRDRQRRSYPDWFNDPVPSFGAGDARLLIVGLAPGLRGANRTGRPFTGDFAGDLLYRTLLKYGLADGVYGASADDGLMLAGSRITNAVRCVPPDNKPLPDEIRRCRPYLAAEIASLSALKAVLALGQIAHSQIVAALALKQSAYKFGHGICHDLPGGSGRRGPVLVDSYHCSRYNTNTGKLTEAMFEMVFDRLMPLLAS